MAIFTGNETDFFSSETIADTLVFANIDGIFKWDIGDTQLIKLPGAENYLCKDMLKFGNRLCLFNTTEGGTIRPKRVRWTKASPTLVAGNTDWLATGSGFADLDTTLGADDIVAAKKMGNSVVIYGESTIAMMEYKADVNSPFSFSTKVRGIGLRAYRALINYDKDHIFLGASDVYLYRGGTTVERLAGGIREELINGLISPTNVSRAIMVYVEEFEEVRLFFPLSGNTRNDTCFTLLLKTGAWSRAPRGYTGFGFWEKNDAKTWDTTTGTWNEQTARWNDVPLLTLSPTLMLGDHNGVVHEDDNTQNNLSGTAIDGYWTTKDFTVQPGSERIIGNWMELNFEAKGDTVTVEYSTDYGSTWQGLKTITLAATWAFYNYDFELNSVRVRFRFRNNVAGESFSVRYLEIGYMEGSDRGV